MKHISNYLSRMALLLGLMATTNAFADDFSTALESGRNDAGRTEAPLLPGSKAGISRSCGWSIHDYVRNCGRSMDTRIVRSQESAGAKS